MTNAAGHLKALHEFVGVVGQVRFLPSHRALIAERPASLFISRLLRYITLLTAVITARLSSGDHYTSARPDIATERPIDPGRGAPAFIRVFMRPLFLLGRRNLVRQHAFPPAVALTSATTAICDGLPACVRYWILLSRARPIDPLIINHFIPHFSAPTLASVSAPARTLVPEIEGYCRHEFESHEPGGTMWECVSSEEPIGTERDPIGSLSTTFKPLATTICDRCRGDRRCRGQSQTCRIGRQLPACFVVRTDCPRLLPGSAGCRGCDH